MIIVVGVDAAIYLCLLKVSDVPVVLYPSLMPLPKLHEESRPQSHEDGEEYGGRVVHDVRNLKE